MIRTLALALLLLALVGCQFLEQVVPPTSDPVPNPRTQDPRFSPTFEIPPPRY